MKKLFLIFLIFPCMCVQANELIEDYFDIASGYGLSGDYTSSASYLDKILQAEPDNSSARQLKVVLMRVSDPNQKSYLSQTNLSVQKANNSKRIGNEKDEVIALKSENGFWQNFLLARHYSENSDSINSINFYSKAMSFQPDYSYSYLGLGAEYIKNGDYQKAVEVLNNYLSINVNSDIAYALRANAYTKLGCISQAQSDIENALKIDNNLSYLFIEAVILYDKGEYDFAREKFINLSRTMQNSQIYKYIGLCFYAQKDYANALINFDKAIILSDDDKDLIKKYNDIKLMLGGNCNEKGNGDS